LVKERHDQGVTCYSAAWGKGVDESVHGWTVGVDGKHLLSILKEKRNGRLFSERGGLVLRDDRLTKTGRERKLLKGVGIQLDLKKVANLQKFIHQTLLSIIASSLRKE